MTRKRWTMLTLALLIGALISIVAAVAGTTGKM